MAISVRLIGNPTDAQIEEAVQVTLRAFEGDVALDSMTGSNDELRAPLCHSIIRAAALEGAFYIANDGSDNIISVGMWFGPGTNMFTTDAQKQLGWNNFFASLTPEAQNWWAGFNAKHEPELDRLIGSKYLDGWFANIIATDPVHQRQGYASAIIKAVQTRATEENKTVSLATQNAENCGWYQRLGFKLLGEIELPGEKGTTWPDFFLSWEPSSPCSN